MTSQGDGLTYKYLPTMPNFKRGLTKTFDLLSVVMDQIKHLTQLLDIRLLQCL